MIGLQIVVCAVCATLIMSVSAYDWRQSLRDQGIDIDNFEGKFE